MLNAFELSAAMRRGEKVPSTIELWNSICKKTALPVTDFNVFLPTAHNSAESTEDAIKHPIANAHLWDSLVIYSPHTKPPLIPRAVTKFARPPIEPNRPIQNGVSRPSIGTRTREMWDACTALVNSVTYVIPNLSEMKAYAISKEWDVTTMTINYYRWRKFNGIICFTKKGKS